MLERFNPDGVCPPPANYSHATVVPAGARWLFASGQLGARADGSIPDGMAEQTEQAFWNVQKLLERAGMSPSDIVRLSAYLTDPADLQTYMQVRDRHVAAPPPCSTLVVVRALARPEFKIEVEVVAARSDTI